MSEKRPQDHCKDVTELTTEAAELAEYLQNRVNSPVLDPQFDALVELIDRAHQEGFVAEMELDNE